LPPAPASTAAGAAEKAILRRARQPPGVGTLEPGHVAVRKGAAGRRLGHENRHRHPNRRVPLDPDNLEVPGQIGLGHGRQHRDAVLVTLAATDDHLVSVEVDLLGTEPAALDLFPALFGPTKAQICDRWISTDWIERKFSIRSFDIFMDQVTGGWRAWISLPSGARRASTSPTTGVQLSCRARGSELRAVSSACAPVFGTRRGPPATRRDPPPTTG